MNERDILAFSETIARVRAEIGKEIIGQKTVVEHMLMALVAGGNVLLEGVPGLGKTRLVRALGRVFDLPFSRIQFTPDLMPADITGTNIIVKTEEGNAFEFRPGPLFASIVLADEINRATPKTQSALLEAMQEHSVTVAGSDLRAAGALFRAGHAEPRGAGGHLSFARGAARPLSFQGKRAFPLAGGTGRDRGFDHRRRGRRGQPGVRRRGYPRHARNRPPGARGARPCASTR